MVIYSSVDDVFARPIAEQFEKKTGIKVKLVPDTEETKSTGLLNRLIAEKDRPQADVFWSGDPVRAAVLKSKGISEAYRSKEAKGLPPEMSDPESHWIGFSARARVILLNTNLIKPDSEPKGLQDFVNPAFKGKACIANPLFGTTSMHAVAIIESMGEEKGKKFFEDMLANEVKVLSSNGEIRRRVSAGDCAFGLTDTDDAAEAIRDGKPVKVIYPDQTGIGTLIVPNAAVLIAGAPHSENGKKFIDYLLSPETEQGLAESDAAQIPVRKGVKVPLHVTPLEKIKSLRVNYQKLGEKLEPLSKGFLKTWVEKARK